MKYNVSKRHVDRTPNIVLSMITFISRFVGLKKKELDCRQSSVEHYILFSFFEEVKKLNGNEWMQPAFFKWISVFNCAINSYLTLLRSEDGSCWLFPFIIWRISRLAKGWAELVNMIAYRCSLLKNNQSSSPDDTMVQEITIGTFRSFWPFSE